MTTSFVIQMLQKNKMKLELMSPTVFSYDSRRIREHANSLWSEPQEIKETTFNRPYYSQKTMDVF